MFRPQLLCLAAASLLAAGASVAHAQDLLFANIVELSGPGTTS